MQTGAREKGQTGKRREVVLSWKSFCEINNIAPSYSTSCVENLKNFSQEAAWFVSKPTSLLLMGDSGRGKTYFLFALLHALFDKRGIGLCEARYLNAAQIEERVDEELERYRSARGFISSLGEVPVLFIDDFGVERTRERAERNYYTLTNERVSHCRPTVISTNLTNQEISQKYGSRINSRLKTFKRLMFAGPDLRGVK